MNNQGDAPRARARPPHLERQAILCLDPIALGTADAMPSLPFDRDEDVATDAAYREVRSESLDSAAAAFEQLVEVGK